MRWRRQLPAASSLRPVVSPTLGQEVWVRGTVQSISLGGYYVEVMGRWQEVGHETASYVYEVTPPEPQPTTPNPGRGA